jgi:hypothetical protein
MMIVHRSSFIVHRSSFIVHRSSFIIHRSSFIVHHSSFIIHRSSFIVHRSSFIVHRSSFIVHHSSFIVHRSSFIVHRSSFIVHRSSFIVPSPPRLLGRALPAEHITGPQRRVAEDTIEVAEAHPGSDHPLPAVSVTGHSRLPRLDVVSKRLQIGAIENRGVRDIAGNRRHAADAKPFFRGALEHCCGIHQLCTDLRCVIEERDQVVVGPGVVVIAPGDPSAPG